MTGHRYEWGSMLLCICHGGESRVPGHQIGCIQASRNSDLRLDEEAYG